METKPNITDFSHELLCHILQYLPLREILSVAMLSKKMLAAADMHLTLCKDIDFCQGSVCGYMPSSITDDHLLALLKKCPHLETVYGLHPVKIERRRLRKRAALTIPGIIEALSLCYQLKGIETSDLRLFEAIMQHLPQVEIIGHFQNRDGLFPPQASQRLKLQPYPRISSLHLIGVEVPELTAMPHLQHLHLQCVRFTKLQPFRAFLAQNLKSFVMKHCIGPSVPQRYLSLIIALSSSPNLSHLELVRVPLLNGLFQRAVEDSYRHSGFVNLKTLVISGCKGILEADLGHLMIVSSKNLETLYIQPSLTKDSLFVSLSFAQCLFPVLQNLHLGYIDNLNSSGEWSNDALLSFGLAEVPDTPSSITDSGMKVISQLFPHIKGLSVSNCPHLMVMYQWMVEEDLEAWSKLTDLTLQKCHCLQLSSFVLFISFLPSIQVVILNDMFREPPKGCSHVGLSAGTGLGMSSAVVSNQDEHIAVQGHHQEFEHPGDEENEENEREFIDVENEDNPEPQVLVLQRDFFEGENDDGAPPAAAIPPFEEVQGVERQINVSENKVNNNFPSNENTAKDPPKSSLSVDDKHIALAAFPAGNQNQDEKEYKCHLRQVQNSLPSKSENMSNNIRPVNNCHSYKQLEKDSDDEMHIDDKPGTAISSINHSNYVDNYDPHKPSTSKAGNHLNYPVTHPVKEDKSDSDSNADYPWDVGSKRLKKIKNEHGFSKKMKMPVKMTNSPPPEADSTLKNDGDGLLKVEAISCDPNSESFYPDCNSFHEQYEIIKPRKALVNKFENDVTSCADNNFNENADVKSEPLEPFSEEDRNISHECNLIKSDPHDIQNSNSTRIQSGLSVENTNIIQKKINVSKNINAEKMPNVHYVSSENIEFQIDGEIVVTKEETSNDTVSENNSSQNAIYSNPFLEIKCEEALKDRNINTNAEADEHASVVETDDERVCDTYIRNDENSCLNIYVDVINDSDDQQILENEYINNDCTLYVTTSTDDLNCTAICVTSSEASQETLEINITNSPRHEILTDDSINNPLNDIVPDYINNIDMTFENQPVIKNDAPESFPITPMEYSSMAGIRGKCKRRVVMEDGYSDVQSFDNNTYSQFESFSGDTGRVSQTSISSNEFDNEDRQSTEMRPCYVLVRKVDDIPAGANNLKKRSGILKSETNEEYENNFEFSSCVNSCCKKLPGSSNQPLNNSFGESSNTGIRKESEIQKLKPCCVVMDKMAPIPETGNISCDHSFKSKAPANKNSSVETSPGKCTFSCTCQASTSKQVTDIQARRRRKYSRFSKTGHSPGSFKSQSSVAKSKDENLPVECHCKPSTSKATSIHECNSSCASSRSKQPTPVASPKREKKCCKRFKARNSMRSETLSDSDVDDSSHKTKKLKKLEKPDSSSSGFEDDNEHDSYHLLVPDNGPIRIVNSVSGQTFQTPTCRVWMTRISSRNCHKLHKKSKYKDKVEKESGPNPNLPSTSTADNSFNNGSEIGKNRCHRCGRRHKKNGNRHSLKNSDGKLHNVKHNSRKSTLRHSVRVEKLQINNSDAKVVLKHCYAVRKSCCVSHKTSCSSNDTRDVKKSSDKDHNTQNQQDTRIGAGNPLHVDKVVNDSQTDPSSSLEKRTAKSSGSGKRKRKSVTGHNKKTEDYSSNSVVQAKCTCKCHRRKSKKVPSVPMMSLISQGSQATSADIRRSVRRIRRASAHRKPVSPVRVSKNPVSNKISAKSITKKPIDKKPRPESYDKATSTSDPLLEDDAVQTLQLASSTLLSFTVVSCGISDLIIDRCPKLFHLEVQACRILKKIQFNTCSSMKRLNVSQCPKLNICALVTAVMSLNTDSSILVSYEPCMQGYYLGEGEKTILSRTSVNQSVLICHDFCNISIDNIQANFREKIVGWLRFLSHLHLYLNYSGEKVKRKKQKFEISQSSEYPWSHDLRRIRGQYTYSSSDFCDTEGQYQVLTNNPIFCDVFETSQLDAGFPDISSSEAYKDTSCISCEVLEKYFQMQKKFVAFYIPVTDSNRVRFS